VSYSISRTPLITRLDPVRQLEGLSTAPSGVIWIGRRLLAAARQSVVVETIREPRFEQRYKLSTSLVAWEKVDDVPKQIYECAGHVERMAASPTAEHIALFVEALENYPLAGPARVALEILSVTSASARVLIEDDRPGGFHLKNRGNVSGFPPALTWSLDGRYLAVGGGNGEKALTRVFSVEGDQCVAEYEGTPWGWDSEGLILYVLKVTRMQFRRCDPPTPTVRPARWSACSPDGRFRVALEPSGLEIRGPKGITSAVLSADRLFKAALRDLFDTFPAWLRGDRMALCASTPLALELDPVSLRRLLPKTPAPVLGLDACPDGSRLLVCIGEKGSMKWSYLCAEVE
jgi:hypothetical protein